MPILPRPPTPRAVVILDTSEVQRDWFFAGLTMSVLRFMSWNHHVRVVLPAVVVEELTVNHDRGAAAADLELRRLNRQRTRAGLPAAEPADEPADYRSFLEEYLDEAVSGWEVASWPQLHHRDAAAASLARLAPFDHTDRGYRDLLIWSTALEYAAAGHDVFLSSRDRDFAGPGGTGLAANLAAEAAACRGAVALVSDLGSWLVERFPAPAASIREAAEIARDLDLDEFLSSSDFLDGVHPDPEELGLPEAVSQAEVTGMDWQGPLTRVQIRKAAAGTVLALYDMPVDVAVEATMPTAAAAEHGWRVLAQVWQGDPAFAGPAQVRAETVIRAAARLVVFGADAHIEQVTFRPFTAQDPQQPTLFAEDDFQ